MSSPEVQAEFVRGTARGELSVVPSQAADPTKLALLFHEPVGRGVRINNTIRAYVDDVEVPVQFGDFWFRGFGETPLALRLAHPGDDPREFGTIEVGELEPGEHSLRMQGQAILGPNGAEHPVVQWETNAVRFYVE